MNFDLSANVKGALYLGGGLATFLYINGWFQENLYYLILTASVAAMVYGFVVTDMWDHLNAIISWFKSKQKSPDLKP